MTGPADPLVRALTDLGDLFGIAPVVVYPAAALRAAADALDEIRVSGRDAAQELAWEWTGPGGDAAGATARRAIADTAEAIERSAGIAGVVAEATTIVVTGALDLARLVASFRSTAEALGPSASLPIGQLALLTTAVDHIAQGLDVVTRTIDGLAQQTERMIALDPSSRGSPPEGPGSAGGDGGPGPVDPGRGVEVRLPDGSVAVAPNEQAASAVRSALTQQGVPYVWGGTRPGLGLDCSGLTQWAYGQAGLTLPRLAQEQDVGSPVPVDALLPGDLAVWDGHVAMVIGNGQMVEAGDPVSVSSVRTTNAGMGFQGFYRPTTAV